MNKKRRKTLLMRMLCQNLTWDNPSLSTSASLTAPVTVKKRNPLRSQRKSWKKLKKHRHHTIKCSRRKPFLLYHRPILMTKPPLNNQKTLSREVERQVRHPTAKTKWYQPPPIKKSSKYQLSLKSKRRMVQESQPQLQLIRKRWWSQPF